MNRGLPTALLAGLALVAAGCSGGAADESPPSLEVSGTPTAIIEGGVVGVEPDGVMAPVALDSDNLYWARGPLESDEGVPLLLRKSLATGKVSTLAREPLRDFGLAAAAGWVAYATERGGEPPRLLAVRTDGSRSLTLSDALIAPIAARGSMVAWAEERGERQLIIVRDFATGRNWTAADLPRCDDGCYRIDAVGLAEEGVVAVRGAIGAQPSYIVRRGFASPDFEQLEIPNDPQPDLVPSSAGALYYVLSKGWYRWDFGGGGPELTSFVGAAPPQLVRFEAGTWFVLENDECNQRLEAREPNGRATAAVPPETLRAAAGVDEHFCLQLAQLVWTGEQYLSAWFLVPLSSVESHHDEELVGVLYAGAAS